MIISRAPVRITLGGGGTDLESYYSKFGGFLIAAAINKYVYICVNKRFYKSIRLSYSKTEIVDSVEQIKHKIFKQAFENLGLKEQVEAVSVADVPANCGLGSSSSFTVSLLNALHTYKRDFKTLKNLAEEACDLEINHLKEPIGKQDQYIAAYGGVTALTFEKDGNVIVESVEMPTGCIYELEKNIFLFNTGIERSASDILSNQNKKSNEEDPNILSKLHTIKEIGLETLKAFKAGDLDRFGDLLNYHWETKKKLSNKISDPFIDECYQAAIKNGALGGKIMGAGGGGFFMFYCSDNQRKFLEAMGKMGLKHMPYKFDLEGAKIVSNMMN